MKKLRLKQWVKDVLVITLFYSVIVVGVILLNNRFEDLNNKKSADQISYQESAQVPR